MPIVFSLPKMRGRSDLSYLDYYLAYLASVPGNWVERGCAEFKKPTFAERCMADACAPGVASTGNYPTNDELWWVVTCLAGAPERVTQALKDNRGDVDSALAQTAYAESEFYLLALAAPKYSPVKPCFHVFGDYRDGLVSAYDPRRC